MKSPNREWRSLVRDYRASGQTQAAWCAENNINIHSLRYWLRKGKTTSAQTDSLQWLSLSIRDMDDVKENSLTVKIGPAAIDVKPGFDSQLLSQVARVLSAL